MDKARNYILSLMMNQLCSHPLILILHYFSVPSTFLGHSPQFLIFSVCAPNRRTQNFSIFHVPIPFPEILSNSQEEKHPHLRGIQNSAATLWLEHSIALLISILPLLQIPTGFSQ